jgi:hypothetical protein
MDEQEARIAAASDARLAAVFRDAADGAPAPGFDAGDVVTASRRITRRRRSMLAGAALAVLAVVGVGSTAGLRGGAGGSETVTASSAGAADERAEAGAADADGSAAAERAAAPQAAPVPGAAAASPDGALMGAAAPAGAPLGPGTGECADRQDPALRALVEQVLPEVVGAPEAMTTQECRPGGERDLALEVPGGLLSVTYLPPAATPKLVDGARVAPTASGGTVVVASRPGQAGEPAPFASRLDALVADLAPRL